MACRPQSNPTITSSDGVPPELAILGFQRVPACTGQTGRRYRSDRSAQDFAGVDRCDDRSCILAHSSVLARFCVSRWLTGEGGATLRQCSSRTGTTCLTDEACDAAAVSSPAQVCNCILSNSIIRCLLCYTDTGTGIRYDTYRIRGYALFQKTLIRGYD